MLGLAGSPQRWRYRPWLVVLSGIDVTPLGGVSAILVIVRQPFSANGCFLCLVAALTSLVLVYWAAIRGFTDSLRNELIHDRSGVRLAHGHLPAVNTPNPERRSALCVPCT